MTLTRRIGFGFLLGVDRTGSTSFTNIATIVDGFKGADAKVDTADITILSDVWKKFAKTVGDGGNVTYMIAYDPQDATSILLSDMLDDMNAAEPNWQITYPSVASAGSGATETFKGHLVGMSREVTRDKLVTCEITIKVSGAPGFTTS